MSEALKHELPLSTAQFVARRLELVLAKHCSPLMLSGATPAAIAIVGEIRRKRPRASEIAIIAIPRFESEPHTGNLFGEGVGTLADTSFFRELASRLDAIVWRVPGGAAPGSEIRRDFVHGILNMADAPRVKVLCAIATHDSWATTMLIHTGSANHNEEMCAAARSRGMLLEASGLTLRGERIPCQSEHDIFGALRMTYKPPEAR